jgi:hypothetical protein
VANQTTTRQINSAYPGRRRDPAIACRIAANMVSTISLKAAALRHRTFVPQPFAPLPLYLDALPPMQ